MAEMAMRRNVGAPAARVWEIITDIDRAAERMSGIESIERLDGGTGFGVGTKWRETRTMFGKTATEVMEVTHVEPGRSYTVEADGQGAHYVSTLSVEAADEDRSRVSMTFAAEPDGVVGKIMAATIGKLFQGATRKAIEKDLDDIKAAAEAR